MHSTRYIIVFVLIMTSIVALVLALMFTELKPIHDKNEALFNKKAILSALDDYLSKPVVEMSDDEVIAEFGKIEQRVIDTEGNIVDQQMVSTAGYPGGLAEDIDMAKEKKKEDEDKLLPLFIYTAEDGSKYTIVSVRGNGLWDEIWGNIAFDDDLNTIVGVAFDHRAETPGLGAEIKDNRKFAEQFKEKKLLDDNGVFRSVYVRKGGAKDDFHEVDGITGATITADGVTEMMDRGLEYYQPYFEKLKNN